MFFLFILIIITLLAIHSIRIGIQIQNLKIDTESSDKINDDWKVYIYLVIFGKIKILKKNIRKMNLKKLKIQNKDIDIKFMKNKEFKIDYKDLIQNISINKIELYSQIGTQDAALTALLVGFISAVLGIIIRKPKYEVIPVYSNRNFLKINLNCIIYVHLMQYIYKLIFDKIRNSRIESFKKNEEV